MTFLDCPTCQETFAQYTKLLSHISDRHVPSSFDDGDEPCPECDGKLTKDTLHFHLPCFVDIDPDVVPLLRDTENYLCPICTEPIDGEDSFRNHINQHTSLERAAFLTDSTTCSGCGKTVTPGERLRDHIPCLYDGIPKNGKTRYECPACGQGSDDKNKLLWHIWVDHWGASGLRTDCPGCGNELNINELRQHLACIDEYEPHAVMHIISLRCEECPFCSYDAFNRKRLGEHVREEHFETLAPDHRCPDCGKDLDDIGNRKLEYHYPSLANANDIDFDYDGANTLLACPKCLSRVTGVGDLLDHVEDEHSDLVSCTGNCIVCDRSVEKNDHIDCIAACGSRSPDGSEKDITQDIPPALSLYPSPSESIRPQKQLNSGEQQSYYEDLRSFIKLERDTSRKESWRKYRNTPLHQLKFTTDVIQNLVAIGERFHPEFDKQYVFERPIPEHEEDPDPLTDRFRIYPGEKIILGSTENKNETPVPGTVTFTDDQTIGISPETDGPTNTQQLHDDLTQEENSYHVVHLLNPKPFDREQKAIQKLSSRTVRSDIIAGRRSLSEKRRRIGNIYAGQLNEHQAKAASRALGAEEVFCIHGPPGTGKTRTLTAIIELAVARGERVLACAHSNPATDNLLVGTSSPEEPDEGSLHATVQDTEITMARVGHNSKNPVVKRNYAGVSPNQADIVGSTTNATAELEDDEFDLVVVDEATQASQPATFVPWLKGNKIVLAGDHRQLPPYCSNETAKDEDMHISLFEHLLDIYGEDIAERLDVQYRMNSDIADFSIDTFYDGNLSHGENNKDWTVNDLFPIVGIDIPGEEKTEEDTHSKYNPTEAKVVARTTRQVMNEGLEPEDIGIITPYTAQIKVIDEALEEMNVEDHRDIKIDTVDSFQGSERKAIIVSFVRSNNDNNSGFLAFPDEGKRRLNVAITRAQRRLSLIGDWDTLGRVADHRSSKESCAHVYAELVEYLCDLDCMNELNKSQYQ